MIELLLLCGNHGVRIVFGLVLNEQPHGIPDGDQALDAVGSGHGHVHRRHAAVFAVVEFSIHQRIGEVADGRIGGDRFILFLVGQLVHVIFLDAASDVLDGLRKQLTQLLILIGNAGRLWPKGTADFLHLTKHHLRIVHEVLVHGDAVLIGGEVDPSGINDRQSVPFLEEQNIRRDLRAGSAFECVVGQPNCAQQVRPLRDILPHVGVGFVHGALAGHESNDTAWSDFVQRFCEEVIMDQEVVLVVLLVRELEVAEGDISNSDIKKAVRELRLLEALNSDGRGLI